MMNRSAAIICVLMLILVIPCASGGTDAAESENLWLYEVMPTGSFEAVTIYNGGTAKIDLKNYYLDDGEGTVRFTNSILIGPKCSVTISSAVPEPWFTDHTVYVHGTNGIIAKQFILADAGDEVRLRKTSGGGVLDSFVYGNGDTKISGWTGPAFGKIAAGKMAARCSSFDTDTANDWKLSVAGRTEENTGTAGTYDSLVTPFVFPDSKGEPILKALEGAVSEVLISVYLFDHRDVVSLLIMLLEKGVAVKILLEGSPAGGVPDIEVRYMNALCEKGAEIFLIKTSGVYKRYDLVHNKYAVIDSAKVIITSENWRESSFTGNRGWGAVIESKEYAAYMREIFFADCDVSRPDIHSFGDLYPRPAPVQVPRYRSKEFSSYASFAASVTPVLSPDFSFEYLRKEMLGATERIYAEQMSIQYAWTDTTLRSPLSWSLTAAKNGADVRILADVSFDTDDGGPNSNYTTVSIIDSMDGLRARTIGGGDGFGLTHNKGVIIDDTVWVSSVNWTNASFMNNREAAAEIHSGEVADYFAYYFLLDWGDDPEYIETELTVCVTGSTAGEAVILDASFSVFPKGTVFAWDLDGDGYAERIGIKVAASFPEGANSCVLIATDPFGCTYVYEFTVTVYPKDTKAEFFGPYIKYAPLFAVMLVMFAVAVVKARGRER